MEKVSTNEESATRLILTLKGTENWVEFKSQCIVFCQFPYMRSALLEFKFPNWDLIVEKFLMELVTPSISEDRAQESMLS